MGNKSAGRQKRAKREHIRQAVEQVEPIMADGYTCQKRAVLTKVDEGTYNKLKELQARLGYGSMYALVEGLVYLQLRCIRDYPSFHDGREPERFSDLEDMLEMYSKHRIPLDLS